MGKKKSFIIIGVMMILVSALPLFVRAETDGTDEEANVSADSETSSAYDLFDLTDESGNQNSDIIENAANSNTQESESVDQNNQNSNDNKNTNANGNTNENNSVNSSLNVNTATNKKTDTTNTDNEPSDEAITIAECIIFQKLEIYDSRCDQLTRGLNCPDYAGCLGVCENIQNRCFVNSVKGQGGDQYNECVATHKTCLDVCADNNSECSKKYPTRNAEGEAKVFQLINSTGDVRVTYEDNPTPYDMQPVAAERTVQIGATIFTGDKGSTRIILPNGTEQFIAPNTYFRIADYYSGDNVDQTITMLKNGNARIKIPKPDSEQSGKKVEYVVITPLWKVEARGTEFDLTVQENGVTKLTTFSGEVQLHDHLDTLIAAVPAGEHLTTDSSGNVDSFSDGVFFPSESAYYINAYGKIAIIAGIIVILAGGLVTVVLIKRKRKKIIGNGKQKKK